MRWHHQLLCLNQEKSVGKNKSSKFYISVKLAISTTLVRPTGVEPATSGFEVRNSIQLSYGRLLNIIMRHTKTGAEDGIRTRDVHLGKVTLYH